MAKYAIELVKEKIYYSYSNLAMSHSAIDKGQEKYGILNFMIRTKLFKGLIDGTMNMQSIFADDDYPKIFKTNLYLL